MGRYRRILSAEEKIDIERTLIIPKNYGSDWELIYPRGSVVFLFDREEISDEEIEKYAQAIAEAKQTDLWYLDFEADIVTTADKSGNWKGAKITSDLVRIELAKVTWTKF